MVDPALGRDAVGAKVTIDAGGRRFVRNASAAGSYLRAPARASIWGLAPHEQVDGFVVRWPRRWEERFAGGLARRLVTLRRGEGKPAS